MRLVFGLSSGYHSILSSIEIILKQATKAIKFEEIVVKWGWLQVVCLHSRIGYPASLESSFILFQCSISCVH